MDKKFDTLVLLGRFQPVHNAHAEIIRRAGQLAKQVIIIVGSVNQPRTYKNPFTAGEREGMLANIINSLLDQDTMCRIERNIDTIYNDQAWASRVQEIVAKHTKLHKKIGIIGHKKSDTSYFDMFPQWEFVDVGTIEPLNATSIRDLYFRADVNMNFIKNVVPNIIYDFLNGFRNGAEYRQIIKERVFVETYKQQFASLPYPPIFVTTDACVIQSGHVLMIKRRSEPGKGLWALPGGFVNANSDASILDAMLRELKEETGIKVPVPVLKGSVQDTRVFDAIDRSARGRTITHAFKIVLPDGELPKVKGMDDAEKAQWNPISQISSEICFEDHYDIVSWAVGG